MKTAPTILAFFLMAMPLVAQERADYSRGTLTRLFVEERLEAEGETSRDGIGALDFNVLGMPWQFNYPMLVGPLSGTGVGVTQHWPDPFALTGTVIATSKGAWRTQRARNAELRRINRMQRARFQVSATMR